MLEWLAPLPLTVLACLHTNYLRSGWNKFEMEYKANNCIVRTQGTRADQTER